MILLRQNNYSGITSSRFADTLNFDSLAAIDNKGHYGLYSKDKLTYYIFDNNTSEIVFYDPEKSKKLIERHDQYLDFLRRQKVVMVKTGDGEVEHSKNIKFLKENNSAIGYALKSAALTGAAGGIFGGYVSGFRSLPVALAGAAVGAIGGAIAGYHNYKGVESRVRDFEKKYKKQ